MRKKMFIVYMTVNNVNGKMYVGIHGTDDPYGFDGYLGNGVMAGRQSTYCKCRTPFQAAVQKYGPGNFRRMTIKAFDTLDEAMDLERRLVDEEFARRTDTYNVALGGGVPPDPSKRVCQYDMSGRFLAEWDSIGSVVKHYGVNKDRIRMVIRDKRSFAGCYWSEERHDVIDVCDYRASSRGTIRQYSTDGLFLGSFDSTSEAAKALDLDRQAITNAIYGKYATGGCWFLKEGETIDMYLHKTFSKRMPIHQYAMDGTYMRTFGSHREVKAECNVNKCDMVRAMKRMKPLAGSYWSYDRYGNILEESPEVVTTTQRKVYQYAMDGTFVREWPSISECRKEYRSVLQVCLGKRRSCGGHVFSFDKPRI